MSTRSLQLCLFISLTAMLASAYQAAVQQLPFFSPDRGVSWVFYASTLSTISIAVLLFTREQRWLVEKNVELNRYAKERGFTIAASDTSPLIPSLSGSIGGGIACALVGLFVYLWASRHSPYNPLGAMMMGGLENYVLKEPFYTIVLLVAAGLGLLGIALLVLGLIDRAKLS